MVVHAVVAELHLFVVPIIEGGGKPTLPSDVRVELELLNERRFQSGVVLPPLPHQNVTVMLGPVAAGTRPVPR